MEREEFRVFQLSDLGHTFYVFCFKFLLFPMLLKFLILTQICADTVLNMPIYREIETRAFTSNIGIFCCLVERHIYTYINIHS